MTQRCESWNPGAAAGRVSLLPSEGCPSVIARSQGAGNGLNGSVFYNPSSTGQEWSHRGSPRDVAWGIRHARHPLALLEEPQVRDFTALLCPASTLTQRMRLSEDSHGKSRLGIDRSMQASPSRPQGRRPRHDRDDSQGSPCSLSCETWAQAGQEQGCRSSWLRGSPAPPHAP